MFHATVLVCLGVFSRYKSPVKESVVFDCVLNISVCGFTIWTGYCIAGKIGNYI